MIKLLNLFFICVTSLAASSSSIKIDISFKAGTPVINKDIACSPALFKTNTTSNNYYIDASLANKDVLQHAIVNSEKSLHVFSHGRPGALLIDGKWLEKEAIARFLNSNFSSLTTHPLNINIYGCNFAQGEKGENAVAYLEKELGIHIAASTNITGEDGDWILEAGSIPQKPLTINYNHNLQLGKKHFLPPHVAAKYGSNTNWKKEEIVLSTPSPDDIEITVKTGTGSGLELNRYTISKGSPKTLSFQSNTFEQNNFISIPRSKLGKKQAKAGYRFSSPGEFYVNYRSLADNQASSLTSKAEAAFGKEFLWAIPPSYLNDKNHTYISIMAEELATVTISDYNSQIVFSNGESGTIGDNQIVVTLAKHESIIYEIKASNNEYTNNSGDIFMDGHIGATITAIGGNIVVNTGAQNGKFTNANQTPPGSNQDHGIDQLVPISRLGNEYVVIRGNGTGTKEVVSVLATKNNTTVEVNGILSPDTIDKGDYLTLRSFTNKSMHIKTNKRVYVHHALLGKNGDDATQGLNFIPPLRSSLTSTTIGEIAKVGKIDNTEFEDSELNIVFEKGKQLTVKKNNTSVTIPTPQSIEGTDDFVFVNITSVGEGAKYTIESNGACNVSVFGANGLAAFASYYSGFAIGPKVALKLTSNIISITNNNCQEPGDNIEYTFAVTNTGDEVLTFHAFTYQSPNDNNLNQIIYESGDDNFNDNIDLDEEWIYKSKVIITRDLLNSHSGTNPFRATLIFEAKDFDGDIVKDTSGTSYTNDDVLEDIFCNGCTNGATSGAITNNDADGDGLNNVCDLDADNDGITNLNEGAGDENCNVGFFHLSNREFFIIDRATSSYLLLFNYGIQVNSVGYNEDDGLIYGITKENGVLPNGTPILNGQYVIIDPVAQSIVAYNSNTTNFAIDSKAGDVYDNWHYSITNGESKLNVLNLDIDGEPETINFSGEFSASDFVIIDNVIYGVEGTKILKLKFTEPNPTVESVEFTFDDVDTIPTSDSYGAAFVAENNKLFVTNNSGGLYRIKNYKSNSPTAFYKFGTTVTSQNDGASCPKSSFEIPDTDGDGIEDYLDPDSDNDGCLDVVESGGQDINGDGYLDNGILPVPVLTIDTDGLVDNVINGYNGVTGDEIIPIGYTDDTQLTGAQVGIVGSNFIIASDAIATEATKWRGINNLFVPHYTNDTIDVTSELIYTWTFNNGSSTVSIMPTVSGTGQTFDFGNYTAANDGTYQATITHPNNACINDLRTFTLSNPCLDSAGIDTDADGINDVCDLDDDNDGILDVDEGRPSSTCPVGFFQVIDDGLFVLDVVSESYVSIGSPFGFIVNSAGFNAEDGLIYAIAREDGVDSEGTNVFEDDIITISPDDAKTNKLLAGGQSSTAGDVYDNKFYYKDNNDGLAVYDIDSNTLIAPITIGESFSVSDFSIVNGIAYGVKTAGLFSINLMAASPILIQTPLSFTTGTPSGSFGATFVGQNTRLYAANNNGGLYEITDYTTATPSANFLIPTDPTSSNDGASCPSTSFVLPDTDADGLPDYLDTDSDNDGCPDASEGALTLATTTTLAGGSNGGSLENLGTASNANGIPVNDDIGSYAGGTETTGQATKARVIASDVISQIDIAPSPGTICLGGDITFMASPIGLRVTNFGATGDTTDDTTIAIPAGHYIYRWYKNDTPTATLSTAFTLSITNASSSDGGTYSVEVTTINNICFESEDVDLTVQDDVTSGAIAADQTIIYNGVPVAFTSTNPGGGSGDISYSWEESTDDFLTSTTIVGASGDTYEAGALTSTTQYRRITVSLQNGVICESTPSGFVTVTVQAIVTPGNIATNETICNAGSPAAFTSTSPGGGSGDISYRWEKSTDNFTNFSPIAGSTGAAYEEPASLTITTQYRRIAISTLNGVDAESDPSDIVVVTVQASVDGGVIAGDQTIASGGDPDPFTSTSLGTGSGDISYRWENSVDNFSTFSVIGLATNTTYNAGGPLSSTTQYRRITISTLNGVLCESSSTTVEVTISGSVSSGAIASDETICYNDNAVAFTSTTPGSGGSGSISYRWEKSTDDFTNIIPISGFVGAAYQEPASLTITTKYRRIAISSVGSVESSPTAAVEVTVQDVVTSGEIGSDETINSGDVPVAFTSTNPGGGSGFISYRWEESVDYFSTFSVIPGATNTTYSVGGPLFSTTQYRRITISTQNVFDCESPAAGFVTVTVLSTVTVTPGSIATDETICSGGDPVTFTSITPGSGGGSGSIGYRWEESVDNFSNFSTITGATAAAYNPPPNLTVTTQYRRIAISTTSGGTFESTPSNVITVTVNNCLVDYMRHGKFFRNNKEQPMDFGKSGN